MNSKARSTSFKKGRKKTGGRQKGVTNRVTREIKDILRELLGDRINTEKWRGWLECKDRAYRWKAFELAQHYAYGKPVVPVVSEEIAPAQKIDISAIPMNDSVVN